MNFTHFDVDGNAIMVDVGYKQKTNRTAVASGYIYMNDICFNKIIEKEIKKGDVLTVSQIAGIMACKKTSELIPLCHPIDINKCEIKFKMHPESNSIESICEVSSNNITGVEMEAITGVLISLETIYDMCKSIDKTMTISNVMLLKKSGGKSGDFINHKVSENER